MCMRSRTTTMDAPVKIRLIQCRLRKHSPQRILSRNRENFSRSNPFLTRVTWRCQRRIGLQRRHRLQRVFHGSMIRRGQHTNAQSVTKRIFLQGSKRQAMQPPMAIPDHEPRELARRRLPGVGRHPRRPWAWAHQARAAPHDPLFTCTNPGTYVLMDSSEDVYAGGPVPG